MINLRPYQVEAVKNVEEQWSKHRSTLSVMPTGSGKTIVFAELIRRMPGRAMILAHREELIFQAQRHVGAACGEKPKIEMAEMTTLDNDDQPKVICSSIQTQNAKDANGVRRMERFDPNEFDLLVIDEAHHAPADTYRRCVEYYSQNPKLKILGTTATPDRLDEAALGQIFDSVAHVYEIADAINDGFLVPVRQRMVHIDGLDFSHVRTLAGDLNGRDLAAIMEAEQNLHRIAAPTIELIGDRKTLIFTVTVSQAERMAEIINRSKEGSARVVHGGTPKGERRQLFRDYSENQFQTLVNVGVATEGYDEPGIEVVVMGRPTKSRSLYSQMAGRGMRPLPNVIDGLDESEQRKSAIAESAKPVMEILDFVGNSGRHKLVCSADMLGGNYDDDVVEMAADTLLSGTIDDVIDPLEHLRQTEKDLEEMRRQAEMERLRMVANRLNVTAAASHRTQTIDPFVLFDISPTYVRPIERQIMATDRQLTVIKRAGMDAFGLNKRTASQLIGTILKRRTEGLSSYKQSRLLARFGYESSGMTFDEAGQVIDGLAQNGWKRREPELIS